MIALKKYLDILLISLFVALLGFSPRPHVASTAMIQYSRATAAGDRQNASTYLATVGAYFPWRYDLNIKAGHLAFEAGDIKNAIQYLERPGTVSHLSHQDEIVLGDAYLQAGDPLIGEAIWNHVAEQDRSGEADRRLVDLYLQRKDYASAANSLVNLLAINPADTSLYYQVGRLYAATDPEKALAYLIQAAEVDASKSDQAQSLHDKIRTASFFNEPAYTFLIAGRQLANSGEWELAVEAFRRSTQLKPDYADAWAFLGESLGQTAKQEPGAVSTAGLSELERALQLDPNSVLANTLMAMHWERQKDYEQAKTYLVRAINIKADDPYLYTELASVLSKAGDLPAAQMIYERAIQLAPRESLFYCQLAEFALENQIQIRELALPAARQAITLSPQDPYSLDVMAQVMIALEDYHSAERFLLSALQSDPTFSPAYLHLGTVYLYLQQPDLARQWFSLAESTNPASWVAEQAGRMLEYYFP